MNKIEIKIWANPQGIAEVTRKLPSIIFTEDEKSMFSPDSYDPFTIPDFFSIFYARISYVVSYHFYLTGSKMPFRDNRTVLSVAIPRGYVIDNLVDVFTQLKIKYEDLVNQLNDINGLTDALAYMVPQWIDEYSPQLKSDELQPRINIPGTTNAKGYVLWKNSTVLKQYLKAPVRMDFNGASLMLLLPIGAEQSYAAFLKSFEHVNAEPEYRPKFSVYFPAYKTDAIAVISSLDEELNSTFEKQYCTPIELKGRYINHISDWKIQKTSDNAGFKIGLQFEEQEFRYNVYVLLNNLNRQRVNAKNIESWLVPSIGRIETDGNGCWLILRGAENNSVTQVTFSSNREDYLILNFSFSHNIINLIVEEVFYFDVPGLKREIERKYNFSPKVYYSQNNQQWKPLEMKTPFKGNKQEYKVKLLGNEEYEETLFSMAKDFNSIEIKRKPGLKLTILFEGEIRKWLEADERRNVTLLENTDADRKPSGNKDVPIELSVNLSNNVLELPPFNGNKQFCFKAPGFKTEYRALGANTNELKIVMELVWWKRIWKVKLTYVLIGIFLGYILGCLLPLSFLNNSKGEQPDPSNITDTISVSAPVDSSDIETTYGPSSPGVGVNSGESEPLQQSTEKGKFQQGTNPQIISGNQDPKETPSSTSTPSTSPELTALMQKLQGIDYTHGDLAKAKELAKNAGQLKKNEQFFKDCEFALSVATSSTNRSASFVKNQLAKHSTLQPDQITAIKKITEIDDVFNSDNKSYKTIGEMLVQY